MRKITVTEDNFEKVLGKMRDICNKHRMLEFFKAFSEDFTEMKYKHNPIGFKDSNGKKRFFMNNKLVINSMIISVEKHKFRREYENNKESFVAKQIYPVCGNLITLDLSTDASWTIRVGDKVQFLPFGGFIIWVNNGSKALRFGNPIVNYKIVYIPNFINGKLTNLKQEQAKVS